MRKNILNLGRGHVHMKPEGWADINVGPHWVWTRIYIPHILLLLKHCTEVKRSFHRIYTLKSWARRFITQKLYIHMESIILSATNYYKENVTENDKHYSSKQVKNYTFYLQLKLPEPLSERVIGWTVHCSSKRNEPFSRDEEGWR